MNRFSLAAYAENERRRRRFRADPSGRYGYAALQHLSDNANGFVLDVINDLVLVKRGGFPEFLGTMAQALAAGILNYPSPSTKYARNSAGVYVPGTTLRCQYSATGTPLGILSEPQRQNLLTYSEDLGDASWIKARVTITADATTAPDGVATADFVEETTENGAHAAYKSISATSGAQYTFSAWVKGQNRTSAVLYADGAGVSSAILTALFGLAGDGSVVSSSGAVTARIYSDENSWYRLEMTVTATASAGIRFFAAPASGAAYSYAGEVGKGIYEWGVQVEAGAFATSYIKTEGSTVTRDADNLYVDLSKVPFGAEYTVIAHAQLSPASATNSHALFVVSDGTSNERHRVVNGGAGNTNTTNQWRTGAAVVADILSIGAGGATEVKIATATKTNDFEVVRDGGSAGTDTSGAVPVSPTRLDIGGQIGAAQWSAPIGFLALIPERLSQADMIARTS